MNFSPLRLALIAATAAWALPAAAEHAMLPGTACTSDGSVERSSTGLMVNTMAAANGKATFYCPFVSTVASPVGTKVRYWVNARINASSGMKCAIRSVSAENVTFEMEEFDFPHTGISGGYHPTSGYLNLPPVGLYGAPASVQMRCWIPNVNGVPAGIVSYGIGN